MIKYRQFLLALLTCLSAQQVYSQNLDYVSVAVQCLDRIYEGISLCGYGYGLGDTKNSYLVNNSEHTNV